MITFGPSYALNSKQHNTNYYLIVTLGLKAGSFGMVSGWRLRAYVMSINSDRFSWWVQLVGLSPLKL